MLNLTDTPEPPYYAVIFSSERRDDDRSAYDLMSSQMFDLAALQPGYLGVETIENEFGQAITVSYWESEEAIRNWHENSDHKMAQSLGREKWYSDFRIRVAKVERAYGP